jgi:hypothetical protein
MAPSAPHRSSSITAPRVAAFGFAYAYRAWRFTQALGRPS